MHTPFEACMTFPSHVIVHLQPPQWTHPIAPSHQDATSLIGT